MTPVDVQVQEWTGAESRCLRQAMRLSVRAFAAELGVAPRTVSKWEARGAGTALRPDSQGLLDTMLDRADAGALRLFGKLLDTTVRRNENENENDENDIGSSTLGLQRGWVPAPVPPTVDSDRPENPEQHRLPSPSPASAPSLPTTLPTSTMVRSPGVSELPQEDVDVNRRRFLQTMTTVGLTGPGSMLGWETLRHDLFAAIGGESADLAEWDAIAWEYGSTYTTTPPFALLHELATDLAVARQQLGQAAKEQQRRGLQRVVAQLATYTAQTASNLGNSRESARWWRTARQAADMSGNAEARVWVRGREIVRGLYERRPLEQMLHLADEAMAVTDHPGIGTGDVLGGRAQALAMLGRVDEARQALTAVHEMLDRLPTRVSSDIGSMYGWPEYRLHHVESFIYTHIGDSEQAEIAQERALSQYPAEFFRERALVQLHRAMRLIRDGDVEAGGGDACATLTNLPEAQRIDMVLEVARWAAASVPADERRRQEIQQLQALLALPAAADRSTDR